MRNIRARRRFRIVLTLLLTVCFIVFIESRIEAFVPQIKGYAQLKIEETLNNRIHLSIGSVDGGILKPLAFNNIKIKDEKGSLLFSSIDISRIGTNYRLWDVFFKRSDKALISHFLAKDSRVYINFVTRDQKMAGVIKLRGNLENSVLKGYVVIADAERIDFSGNVKKNTFGLELKREKGTLNIDGVLGDDNQLKMDMKASHLAWRNYDISCIGAMTVRMVAQEDDQSKRYVEGELEAKNVILNYKPFLDLKAVYMVKDGILKYDSAFGDNFMLHGKVLLEGERALDNVLTINNVNLSWLLSMFGVSDPAAILTGTMSGRIELKKNAQATKLTANIEMKKGTIATLDFDTLSASFKGDLPIIRIEDSRISRESGTIVLAGEMDLRKIGKNSFFGDISIVGDDNAITWDGLGTSRRLNVQEVDMKKKINNDLNFGFKKFIEDDKIDESSRYSDKVELEYKLHPNESIKLMVGNDQDFVGLEHKDKF